MRKVLRDLWLQRARTALVVAAVAIGLIGAGSILNTWALVRVATVEGFAASLPVSATLTVDRVDPGVLDHLRGHPQIAAVRARRVLTTALQADGRSRRVRIEAHADFAQATIGLLQPVSGTWPPGDGEIVIETSALDFSGAQIGQTVEVQTLAADTVRLAVAGTVRDVSQAPGWMEHMVYAYVTPQTMTRLGTVTGFNELQLRVRDAGLDRDAVRKIVDDLREQLEASGVRVLDVDVPTPGQHIHAAQMDSLLLTQGAFGLLTLLVCAFLVVNLVSAMLAGQARQIGVMKTLGAGARQIMAMYLAMAFLLGLMATAIALPVALLIGREYADLKAELLNFPIAGYAVPTWAIALQVLVGCLLPVAAAAVPVLRSCATSVGSALRDIGIVGDDATFAIRRRVHIGALPRPLLLALGNAFRRRQRMALTLLALAAGGAVFLGAANLKQSVQESVDLIYSAQRFDFSLRLAQPQSAATVEAVAAAVVGIERSEAWRGVQAQRVAPDGRLDEPFAVVGLPPGSAMVAPQITAGRWLQTGDAAALVVSRRLAREHALNADQQIVLRIDGQPRTWTIVGIVEAGPQMQAWTTRASLDEVRGNDDATSLVVSTSLRSLPAQLDTIVRLRAALEAAGMPVASSQGSGEGRRVLEDHLLMVVEFLGLMGWVMVVVGGMGLASTMSLAVLERTREIGVMRAIGAGHGTIKGLIQVEGLVIAGLSVLLALPLSIPMSVLLAQAFGRIMFTVPVHYLPNALACGQWLALALTVSLLACAWPARGATRISARAALSYE